MKTTLAFAPSVTSQIMAAVAEPLETAGVLLASTTESNGELRLLAREFIPVPEGAYLHRADEALSIASDGYVQALGRAETIHATAFWVHTHPGAGASPRASSHDAIVDRELAELFRIRTGSPYYGALIFSPRPDGVAFTGHLADEAGFRRDIDRLWLAGDRLKLLHAADARLAPADPAFDRNVRAFGPAIQATLNDLKVAVVGCGGTGSAVTEQLVRLGVRNLILFDPDLLSNSNVTRVYGSTPADEGRPKVVILTEHAKRIAPNGHYEPVQSSITDVSVARRLAEVDLVFGCTDDNAGRLVLSRLPTYLLTPVIDCGVLISSGDDGQIAGIDGRITIVSPEGACLLCRGRIDVARAGAELMHPAERLRLETEGYAPALRGIEPAVVAFTTLVAASAVSELLERLIGYGPSPRPGEVLLRCHEREISTNIAKPRARHYCHPESHKVGVGVTDPFLELTWGAK